jgi:hypothetical protein
MLDWITNTISSLGYRDLDINDSKTASNLYTVMVLLRMNVFLNILGFEAVFLLFLSKSRYVGIALLMLLENIFPHS